MRLQLTSDQGLFTIGVSKHRTRGDVLYCMGQSWLIESSRDYW